MSACCIQRFYFLHVLKTVYMRRLYLILIRYGRETTSTVKASDPEYQPTYAFGIVYGDASLIQAIGASVFQAQYTFT